MFTIKQLTAPADLAVYQADYKIASKGVTINMDYLQRTLCVVVMYDTRQPDIYLGGYVINDTPPMRYFVAPGEAAKNQALAKVNLREEDLVEIGAIWLRKYQSPFREFHRVVFFAAMLHDALKTKKPYILGGSFILKIADFQRGGLPSLIYENEITVGDFTGNLQLYVGPRAGMWLRFAKTIIKDVMNRITKKSTQKEPSKRIVTAPVS
jgi:hypothetical protein